MTLNLLDRVDVLPEAVMIDLDGTLLNKRKFAGEPTVPRGRIVGLMQACHERRIRLGIQSYWWEDDIHWLLKQHPRIDDMVRGKDEKPFIRGRESIHELAESLAMPDRDLFFMLRKRTQTLKDGREVSLLGTETGYYDFMEDPNLPAIRCPKFPLPGEILLDDHHIDVAYHAIHLFFSPLFPDWQETALAKAMAQARGGLVRIDAVEKPYTSRLFSEAEQARFYVALSNNTTMYR